MKELEEILEKELKENGVTVVSWSKSECGSAFWDTTDIKIPKPVNFETLGVGFHEIAHIVLGHCVREGENKYRYIEEYEAEQYAIKKLKEYGKYNKQYEYKAMAYVLMKIAQAKNRGHDMKKVPKEIVKWTGLQVNKWNKAKKVNVSVRAYKRKGDIKIHLSGTVFGKNKKPVANISHKNGEEIWSPAKL